MSSATAVLTTTGRSGTTQANAGKMALQVYGTTFSGVWRIVRSTDGGTNWVGTTNLGTAITFTGDAAEVIDDPDVDSIYDIEMVSGTGRLDVRWGWT